MEARLCNATPWGRALFTLCYLSSMLAPHADTCAAQAYQSCKVKRVWPLSWGSAKGPRSCHALYADSPSRYRLDCGFEQSRTPTFRAVSTSLRWKQCAWDRSKACAATLIGPACLRPTTKKTTACQCPQNIRKRCAIQIEAAGWPCAMFHTSQPTIRNGSTSPYHCPAPSATTTQPSWPKVAGIQHR